MKPPTVNLRVNVPLSLYERIGEYRHTARHDSKNQALVTLLAAGLAAMTKPVTLPPLAPKPVIPNGKDKRSKLVAFAGADDGRAHRQ
jgi:hypothetical protein